MADEKQPITVWHVENSDTWQKFVSLALTASGYRVVTTGTAAEAREMIPNSIREFKAAILDGNLGDGKGAEIAELIRRTQLPIGIIGLADDDTPWADKDVLAKLIAGE